MTRNRWSFISAAVVAIAVAVAPAASFAQAKTTKIRVQSVIPTSADEVTMLKEFAADVTALTGGSVTFEVLPAGAVVAVNDTLDAVDKGRALGRAFVSRRAAGSFTEAILASRSAMICLRYGGRGSFLVLGAMRESS